MSYDNSMRAAIWPNKDKKGDTHPDFKGQGEIDGVEYWISGWKRKEGDNPKSPSLKLRFEKKDDAHKKGVDNSNAAIDDSAADDFDSDIPF